METRRTATLLLAAIILFLAQPYEGSARQAATASNDCATVTRMWRFMRIYGGPDLRIVEGTKDEICASGQERVSRSWPNKKPMKSGGIWSYPNGNVARTSGGSWGYPNEKVARTTSGAWSYPDGNVARTSGGSWTLPERGPSITLTALKSWACGRVECKTLLAEIANGNDDDEIVAAVELAWSAR